MEEICHSILFVCKTVLSVNTQGASMRLDLYGNVMIICNSLDKRFSKIQLFDNWQKQNRLPNIGFYISHNICYGNLYRCYQIFVYFGAVL